MTISSTDIWDIAEHFKKIHRDEGTESYKRLIRNLTVKEAEDEEENSDNEDCYCDDCSTKRGILVRVRKNKIEILTSPLFKVWCDVCFKNKQHLKESVSTRRAEVLKEITSSITNVTSSLCSCCIDDLIPIFKQIATGAMEGENHVQKPCITKTCDISQLIKRSLTRKSISMQPSGTFNVRAGPIKVFDYELKLKGRAKLSKDVIERIATQTEASKVRTLKEEHLPLCKRTYGGTSTRDFLCEYCRKRNTY